MPIEYSQLLLLCVAAFAAGFVDAIVGGGGLVQTPLTLVVLSPFPVASAIATVKIPSFTGTAMAASQYLRRVRLNWQLASIACALAFFASFAGSELLTLVSNRFMKPVLLVVLTAVAIYTFSKKDFGQHTHRSHSPRTVILLTVLIALVIGFYDGFIGPGTGSFLILAFVSLLGFDFLHASAYAKLVNLATNLGSITLFIVKGKILWPVALPMAVCNGAGGAIGARLAIAKGNRFIRVFFLLVVIATLLRFLYDIFVKP